MKIQHLKNLEAVRIIIMSHIVVITYNNERNESEVFKKMVIDGYFVRRIEFRHSKWLYGTLSIPQIFKGTTIHWDFHNKFQEELY